MQRRELKSRLLHLFGSKGWSINSYEWLQFVAAAGRSAGQVVDISISCLIDQSVSRRLLPSVSRLVVHERPACHWCDRAAESWRATGKCFHSFTMQFCFKLIPKVIEREFVLFINTVANTTWSFLKFLRSYIILNRNKVLIIDCRFRCANLFYLYATE